jgi:glycerol-3-phosphate dehydrogenase
MEFGALSRAEKLAQIKVQHYDVVIIGGGIFGACALREANLRGLKALLVESEDFASGASANSYKIVHGGIRYLQHLDLLRIWSSCRERSGFLRVAPHLVEPLPVMVPTYGLGMLGKPILGLGMLLYDFLTLGRNKGIADPNRHIPLTRFLSRGQVLEEFPDTPTKSLTGACVFNDGRFYNPTRLVWAFVKTAMAKGACALNYLAASELRLTDGRVTGLQVTDSLSGDSFDVACKSILNTSGPWAEHFLADSKVSGYKSPAATYSRDACFVVKRKPTSRYTLAIQGQTSDPDALLSRPARHLFMSPWRDVTLIGVWHIVTKTHPSKITVEKEEIEEYIAEVNESHPDLKLKFDEVSMWNAGLVPFGENDKGNENLSYGKRSILIDHQQTENIEGLITLVGIRYTMARDEAERVLDSVQRKIGLSPARVKSDFIKIDGADFSSFDDLLIKIHADGGEELGAKVIKSLAHNFGSEYSSVLDIIKSEPHTGRVFANTTVTEAELLHCVRSEMVENFSDLVFRRTDAATAGNPGDDTLADMLNVMACECGWSEKEKSVQLAAVVQRFPQWLTNSP